MARRQRPGTRAKDSDRADICQILDTALAEGQLSMEEHRQRVAAATNAPTLAELHGLLTDLQVENAPVKPPRRISAPGWVIASAVGAAVVLVLGLVIWGVFDRDPPDRAGEAPAAAPANTGTDPGAKRTAGPAGPTTAAPSGPRFLHSVDGIAGLFEQMRGKFGDTKGYELSVYTDYAELIRLDTDDDRFEARYRYEAGEWEGPGTSANSGADTVDLSAFDAAAVLGVIRGVPETMDLKPMNIIKTYFTVEPADDPSAPQALTVHIIVSTSFGTGLIDLDGAGNVKKVKQPV
ncbi:DUF1707 domain-containing protein [Mycobacterium sp. NPDC051804]|uniref:DUF1707 domain-containing protein n=1 Tax=Mycobacterium sp. NPDC051804 TaxID=3364295 RepID=UPI003796794D